MSRYKSFTVYGEDRAELSRAADIVDRCMDNGAGRNEIRYRLTGGQQLGYDTGFITDGALCELGRSFTIVQDGRGADQ